MSEVRKLSEEQKGVLAKLEEHFDLLRKEDPAKWSERRMARTFLSFHDSVLSRLRSDTYTGDVDTKIVEIEKAIRDIREYLNSSRKITPSVRYHLHQAVKDVLNAHSLAKHSDNENRLIVLLTRSGGGKSALAKYLALEKKATVVEARPSWQNSGFSALQDVCAALGCAKTDYSTCKRDAEQTLKVRLDAYQQTLVFDEAAVAFDSSTAALLKFILNTTPTIVVLAGSLDLHGRMMRSEQGRQLMRRCIAVVTLEEIVADDIEPILPWEFGEHRRQALAMVVSAANKFGLFDTVVRVAAYLADDHKAGDRVGVDEVIAAVKSAVRQTGGVA